MNPVLEIDRVSKRFWIPTVRRETIREHAFAFFRPRRFDRLDVLEEVSFTVQPGETFGIMGRNGCGKSTLLKILCGVYPPDSGAVRRHAPITPVLELGVGWNSELSAVDNIYLLGSVMGLSLAEIRKGLDEMLSFAELERFANLELKHFSSGMASRLGYSVAFYAVREVLILDEIFAVGDAAFNEKCEKRQAELRAAGCATVLVSHDPDLISKLASRAVFLEAGRVVQEGRGDEIAHLYTASLTPDRAGDRSDVSEGAPAPGAFAPDD